MFRSLGGKGPDAVIVSAGLWHMLHIPDPQDYVDQQAAFTSAASVYAAHQKVSMCSGPCVALDASRTTMPSVDPLPQKPGMEHAPLQGPGQPWGTSPTKL